MKTHFIIKRFLLGLALLASCDFGAFAKVVLPVLVSDGMVLQRNAPLTIWGKADPSEKVCVKFQKKQYKVTADENGKWAVTLPAMKAGGPYSMTINDIVLNDILCIGMARFNPLCTKVVNILRTVLHVKLWSL